MMRVGLSLKFAALLIAGLALPAQSHAQNTPVTFALDFRALGRHAAWYVALEKG
jgi:NitT/TauT family transport system substrate-binding protein